MLIISCDRCDAKIEGQASFYTVTITKRTSVYSDSENQVVTQLKKKHFCSKCASKILKFAITKEESGANVESEETEVLEVKEPTGKVSQGIDKQEASLQNNSKGSAERVKGSKYFDPIDPEIKGIIGNFVPVKEGRSYTDETCKICYDLHTRGFNYNRIARALGINALTTKNLAEKYGSTIKEKQEAIVAKYNVDVDKIRQLRFNLKWSYPDIAGDLGISERVVKEVCELLEDPLYE